MQLTVIHNLNVLASWSSRLEETEYIRGIAVIVPVICYYLL